MPRLSKLDDVLFPVEEHPVFVSIKTNSGEKRLPVPDKKAIVNVKTQRVLGIVSRGYRLVTNHQALDWAYKCCQTVFPDTKLGEWEVKNSDAPGTGSYCFIDLDHNSTSLDFSFVQAKDRPDVYGPFIRVTNSYNGLRALAFDIGFYRKVCKNGLILPKSIIRFKFNHMQSDIGSTIRFDIAHEQLAVLRSNFNNYLGVLRDCKVSRSQFNPLLHGVLQLREPKKVLPFSKVRDWEVLTKHITTKCDGYADELGENAYAVFNAITDFASHPPENRCIHRDRNSFQRLAGDWLSKFSHECSQSNFSLSDYLVKLSNNESGKEIGTH